MLRTCSGRWWAEPNWSSTSESTALHGSCAGPIRGRCSHSRAAFQTNMGTCVWSLRVGGGAVYTRTWESGLNSRNSPPSEATLLHKAVSTTYLTSFVCVCVLCQPHWLWKNNLTGFNLLPPPCLLPPRSPHFLFLCASERLGIRLAP